MQYLQILKRLTPKLLLAIPTTLPAALGHENVPCLNNKLSYWLDRIWKAMS